MQAKFCSRACASRQRRKDTLTGRYAFAAPFGASKITHHGYVKVKRDDGRYHYQHRLVMEALLGRPLLPTEQVHHKNGDRMDPRPANLELWTTAHPSGVRVADLAAW